MNASRDRRNRLAFTLMELMIVVCVVGVLAGISVPVYARYQRNARVTEAVTRIGEIVTASRAYAAENVNFAGQPLWPTGSGGLVDLSPSPHFSYAITSGGGSVASNTELVVEATGLNKMDGTRIAVAVGNLMASADAPVIDFNAPGAASAGGGTGGAGGATDDGSQGGNAGGGASDENQGAGNDNADDNDDAGDNENDSDSGDDDADNGRDDDNGRLEDDRDRNDDRDDNGDGDDNDNGDDNDEGDDGDDGHGGGHRERGRR